MSSEDFKVGHIVFIGDCRAYVVNVESVCEDANDVTFRLENGAEMTMLITSPVHQIYRTK